MRLLLLSSLFAAVIAVGAPAAAVEGPWAQGTKASARLIAAGMGDDGRLNAGIEITMPLGWHTYWRTPGDAGVAPAIDFSASENAGSVDVAFPLPTRLDDGFSVTNVYMDRVLLPVSVVVGDSTKPVDLAVTLDLGVCQEICIPDQVSARLTVPVGESDPAAGAILAEAAALVPSPPEPGVFDVESIVRDGGTDKRPVFRIVAIAPDAGTADVFVEGPTDWWPDMPVFTGETSGKASWTVKFSRLGAETPIAGAAFRVTIASGGRAIDRTLPLD